MTGEGKGREFFLCLSHDCVASFTIPQSALPRGRGWGVSGGALLGTDLVTFSELKSCFGSSVSSLSLTNITACCGIS